MEAARRKRLVAFDLDGTLAESKQAVDEEMIALLEQLTRVTTVAVISGGDWPQFEKQLTGKLTGGADYSRLFILPTSGTKLYRYEGEWRQIYAETFTDAERKRVTQAIVEAVGAADIRVTQLWGDQIEDRGSQITFSALGQQAPLDAKAAWDPDLVKRKRLQAVLAPMLSEFAVRIGGSTSVDITRQGIDKAYGMGKLATAAQVRPQEMIFIGDAIYPGGNDYPVCAAGIDSVAVRDIAETKAVIAAILFCKIGLGA